jgi:hypothetical protein
MPVQPQEAQPQLGAAPAQAAPADPAPAQPEPEQREPSAELRAVVKEAQEQADKARGVLDQLFEMVEAREPDMEHLPETFKNARARLEEFHLLKQAADIRHAAGDRRENTAARCLAAAIERTVERLSAAPETSPKAIIRQTKAAKDTLSAAQKWAAVFDTAETIRVQLAELEPGEELSTDEIVKDAGLDEETAKAVLRELAHYPRETPEGWLCVESKAIYKLPAAGWRRRGSYLLPLLGPVLLIAAAVLLAGPIPNDNPLGTIEDMLVGLALVVAGAAGHIIIDAYKRRKPSSVPVMSMWGRWWLLHPLQPTILLIAPAVTLAVLGFTETGFVAEGAAVYLLAGYSCDSIARAAFERLDAVAQATAKSLIPTTEVPPSSVTPGSPTTPSTP